ncbi:hypothetical protein BTA51_15000 [Hahella sp. CCB-MM4]|uniref:demethoxyubiquinone hydroxylase family protein n=1 Tax=Hahella sp. (strain CCB-MM4) TaxID=1926491 RepID=UPI000B9AC0A7|nr:demethoxyubiquinone hydroxylase family protein [Hahella sp. CCB-MM4]OZG72434.1 hypothetical protein BTA51_15000 [Hahella sp. CCB-MM4]
MNFEELDIADRYMKVNHSGEFGAMNIYRAQIAVSKIFRSNQIDMLEEFLAHETSHRDIFAAELKARNVRQCRSYLLCGIGGYCLGLISALLGRNSILACTAAVESVVITHLEMQLKVLERAGDEHAYNAVKSIYVDEMQHLEKGENSNKDCVFYKPYVKAVSICTELVIWLGMKL